MQNGDPIRAYLSFKAPDKYVFSEIHTAWRCSSCAWSRALTTAWSRAYCAITIMALNTKLTMVHNREMAEFISSFRKKRSSKGTCQENFTTVSGCFGLGIARVKALGALKKKERRKKEENEDDETRFSPFPGTSLQYT